MSGAKGGSLTTVQIAGGLLPPDVLAAVLAGTLDGLSSSDYHLGGESPREAAARIWTHLLGVYRRFRNELARLPDGDPAVGLTRERWLTIVLTELGYGRVPATGAGGLTIADTSYPVSHLWQSVPIHLLGWGVPLDKRTPGVPGAAHRAPHALVQELLNRSDQHLWAILANGRTLRLLRDSTTLTGQAYVEFDLEAMFDGEVFSEFALLLLLTHQSRLEVPDGGLPADAWLERWRTTAVNEGVRALTLLRHGVQVALETLGTGFLQHPANAALRAGLSDATITVNDVHQALLRTVYRLLFWSVAEDRRALLIDGTDPSTAERYDTYFSSDRLRRIARTRHGSPHDDLWQSVTLVLDALARDGGEPRLGLPGLGGLFATRIDEVLHGARIGNRALLAAVRAFTIVQPPGQPQRVVDFRHLGAEELGSVYESLLELHPRHDPTTHVVSYEAAAGHDRKTTGSYYTPSELVELVLDTALDPILDDAVKQPDPEAALLAITCCDPAVGSGHFLVAAARRIATRLAAVRTGEIDPTPTTVSDAMHDVVAHCVYGVDLNPMAADLAKVSLWLEAMAPGKPLSFLDHHIKVGNALLGTTPALVAAGIPNAAYMPLTGDDKPTATSWRKQNEREKAGQLTLFDRPALPIGNEAARVAVAEIADRAAGLTLGDIGWAEQRYRAHADSPAQRRTRRIADAWCAAFLSAKTPDGTAITATTIDAIAADEASNDVLRFVDGVATRHRLFHWHLEFPEVFPTPNQPAATASGWTGGFTAMLGNPPWERIKLQEREFFAAREPTIAQAKNAAARKKAIGDLTESNPALFAEFDAAKRGSEAESHFLRASGRYPLCGVGDVNTYSLFAEHFRSSLAHKGRAGIITPTGLATDATTAAFFADTLRHERLVAFFDFVTGPRIWSGIGHNRFRFAVTCMTGGERIKDLRLAFDNRHPDELAGPDSTFTLSADEVLRINPNTGTLPIFRSRVDAEITLGIHSRHPVLIHHVGETPWGLRFARMFDMAADSGLFHTAQDLEQRGATFDGWSWRRDDGRWLPLYEAKLLYFFDHRLASYADLPEGFQGTSLPRISDAEHDDPWSEPLARYWVAEDQVPHTMSRDSDRGWFMGFRRLTRADDQRTFIPFTCPATAFGDNAWLAFSSSDVADVLPAAWSSLACDYVVRQKLSGTTLSSYIVEQIAFPAPDTFRRVPDWASEELVAWMRRRVLELTYTSHRMRAFAVDVAAKLSGTGPAEVDPGLPFRWLPDRREALRAELDAAMLRLYGLDREAAVHVMESFAVLRRTEERDCGEFRTKRMVLAAYDAMGESARTGAPFVSPLDPAPGFGPRHPEGT